MNRVLGEVVPAGVIVAFSSGAFGLAVQSFDLIVRAQQAFPLVKQAVEMAKSNNQEGAILPAVSVAGGLLVFGLIIAARMCLDFVRGGQTNTPQLPRPGISPTTPDGKREPPPAHSLAHKILHGDDKDE